MAPRNLRGWLPDVPDHRDFLFRAAPPAAVPPAADVRALLNPPPDQGNLGSCVGNSVTSDAEWVWKKEVGIPADFSRLFVYYEARKIGGFPTSQDTGCFIRDAIKVLANLGVCLESTMPYDVSKFAVAPSSAALKEASEYQALYYYRCTTLDAIKSSIGVDGYPVVGGFSVPESIYSAATSKTGIVSYPAPDEAMVGGHAVIFVGYDDAKQLLTFQNSWGGSWGDGGYGYLPYAYVTNGLADDFWTLRTLEIPPPPPPPPAPKPTPKPRRPRPAPKPRRRGPVRRYITRVRARVRR